MSKTIKIKVLPRSSINQIIEIVPGLEYKVKLKAPPVDGEANKKLIDFLSKEWNLPKSSIVIVKGLTSRNKILNIV